MKSRNPDSFEAALQALCGEIGWAEAAALLGKSESLLRKWCDPDHNSAPSLINAFKLERYYVENGFSTHETAPINARWCRRLSVHSPGQARKNLSGPAEELMDVVTETGRVSELLRNSLADHVISTNEKHDLKAALAKLREEINDLDRSIDAN